MTYASRYNHLNANQKRAVDTIEGPVMVVAGPGTGKTELLSMRAATILQKTDALPETILCLTFTESGAVAMRERLASIIGKDAYKVSVHTFHSFGSEIINQYSEFFYQGAQFRPADKLSSYEIIRGILEELEYTNPLASKLNGEFTHIGDIASSISDLKRSGLTNDELLRIIDSNDGILDEIEPELAELFSRRIGSTTLAQLIPIAHRVASIQTAQLPAGMTPLSSVLALSLAHAVDEATDTDSTKPITAWKNHWLTKNGEGVFVFKDRARHNKLRALSFVYFQYLSRMQEAELYDYDDMILRVVHALEVFDELRFNLQEKYQYIMVDEFQDTNLAQMRILANLTNNPAQGDSPNILVVGDDDQAIYSFQGADISNILSFQTIYPHAVIIPLTDNYRSGEPILRTARDIITQGHDRLESHLEHLDKTLVPHLKAAADVRLIEAPSTTDEHAWLVRDIAKTIADGTAPGDIAVLARRHSEIEALLPHFVRAGIEVAYERRDNVLDLEPVRLLEQLAQVICLLADQEFDAANSLLPELLAHPAWGLPTEDLWKLSLVAYDSRSRWLDTMAAKTPFEALAHWFSEQARAAHTESLETMLDHLFGLQSPTSITDTDTEEGSEQPEAEIEATFVSPLYNYFFSPERLADSPDSYLRFLEGLRTIRTALRDYHTDEEPSLSTFVRFIALYRSLKAPLTSISQATTQSAAVQLMSAHAAKGLEFAHVYVVGAVDSMWGERVRVRSRSISYPENLPIAPSGDSPDERLRLFFVAVTRAKHHLSISYATHTDAGKPLERASFLLPLTPSVVLSAPASLASATTKAEQQWYTAVATPHRSLNDLLAPTLASYKLSATHLGNFLDVTRGGPQLFLLHNLLRFPQAMHPAAAYGSAVHTAMQRAHSHLTATNKQRALEDVIADYETALGHYRLSEHDHEALSQKGASVLQAFLAQAYDRFDPAQKVELSFAGQHSLLGEAHLTGTLDVVLLDTTTRSAIVTDYKTGHPSRSWRGTSDYEKLKLHRYRQQLMFYKLLVENSRDYHAYTVTKGVLQFVEPTSSGAIVQLEDDFSHNELAEFATLIQVVWRHITTVNLPDIGSYEPTYAGVLAFERDLLDETL